MKALINKYLPKYLIVPVLILIVSNLLVYYGTKLINELAGRTYTDMTGAIDRATPVLPWFVLFYVAAYPFWYLSYYFICRKSKELCYKVVIADVAAKLFCGMIFLIIPTTNVRPVLAETGFENALLNLIYANDTPTNLFPSIHCLESWLCFLYIKDVKDFKPGVKIFAFIMAVGICLSTVFTRQHVWVDVLAGVAVAGGFKYMMDFIAERLREKSIWQKPEPTESIAVVKLNQKKSA